MFDVLQNNIKPTTNLIYNTWNVYLKLYHLTSPHLKRCLEDIEYEFPWWISNYLRHHTQWTPAYSVTERNTYWPTQLWVDHMKVLQNHTASKIGAHLGIQIIHHYQWLKWSKEDFCFFILNPDIYFIILCLANSQNKCSYCLGSSLKKLLHWEKSCAMMQNMISEFRG